MLRRSFLKLAAAVLIHPALNWQQVPFDIALKEVFDDITWHIFFDPREQHGLTVDKMKQLAIKIKYIPCCQVWDNYDA